MMKQRGRLPSKPCRRANGRSLRTQSSARSEAFARVKRSQHMLSSTVIATLDQVMGQARQRKKGHAALLAANLLRWHTTGDDRRPHAAPYAVHRQMSPAQFEFPCCDPCNRAQAFRSSRRIFRAVFGRMQRVTFTACASELHRYSSVSRTPA
jgi:hypothetical protein